MSWIIGAIALYCLFAATLIIILSMFSSRLSRQENFEEVWESEQDQDAKAVERHYSHLSSRA